jgi:hypothetical protein
MRDALAVEGVAGGLENPTMEGRLDPTQALTRSMFQHSIFGKCIFAEDKQDRYWVSKPSFSKRFRKGATAFLASMVRARSRHNLSLCRRFENCRRYAAAP